MFYPTIYHKIPIIEPAFCVLIYPIPSRNYKDQYACGNFPEALYFLPQFTTKKHYFIFFIRYKKNLVKPGKPGISQIKIIQCQVFSPKNLVKPGVEKICTKNLVKPGKPGILDNSNVQYQVFSTKNLVKPGNKNFTKKTW